jgi:hypothetical protein
MALTKDTIIDKIEVVEDGTVQVRQATRIVEDDVVISQSYHRWSIAPGQNYSDQTDTVKSICEITHTPAVIAAYEAQVEASKPSLG